MKPKKIKSSLPIKRWPTLLELRRFLSFVEQEKHVRKGMKSRCLNWTGHLDKDGYPQFHFDGRTHWAHRLSYQFFKHKKLKPGREANHKCLNQACVHPDHLEDRSKSWNSKRNENGRRNGNGQHVDDMPF